MKRALVVGGSSGVGRALVIELLKNGLEHVYIVDKSPARIDDIPSELIELYRSRTSEYVLDLCLERFDLFDDIQDIDTLIITAGFGRLAPFDELSGPEINNLIKCNELAPIRIIQKYYNMMKSQQNFNCAVMVSIAGHVVSPLFSVYGAAKSGLAMFIENVNTELAAQGFDNRILDCSPGSIKGTAFNGGTNDYTILWELAKSIISNMCGKETLYIPDYDEVYRGVIQRYKDDPKAFGLQSYEYKIKSGRMGQKSKITIGYLSGTFDLFHIGHLNLIRRAKGMCDYLIVGVHESGAWKGKETFIPFEERKEIVKECRYVDKVVSSCSEDSDAWDLWHYDKLFVGSDYKGSERFEKYERYFADKNVEIVYLPYTQSTSSTQIRKVISMQTS